MADPAAIALVPGVWRVPTVKWDLINSYVFRDHDGQVTLVDTGLKSAPKRILAALAGIGSDPSDVTRIVLTHSHSDHVSGAAELVDTTGAAVAVHSDDAESVRTGRAPSLDPTTLGGRLMRRPLSFTAVAEVEELSDGQLVEVGGGLRIVHTPGHSPGHVSLLHEQSGLLITGDAIWNIRRHLTWPVLTLCHNIRMTQQTADTLGELDYDVVAFTHGPEIREAPREAVRSFLREPRGFRAGF